MESGFSNFIGDLGWPLLYIGGLLTLLLAVFDHQETTSQIVKSSGMKKVWLHIKRVAIWATPIIIFAGTVIAQIGSDTLEAKMTARHITAAQKDKFRSLVLNKLKGAVEIDSLSSDKEGAAFAKQLSEMLKANGYSVTDNFGSQQITGPPPIGLILEIKDANNQPQWGGPLQVALTAIGLDASGQVGHGTSGGVFGGVGSPDPNAIVLLVGCKP